MKTEIAGITRANEGIQGISWNILGQTYVPKTRTEHSFSWHATFPPGTFVPPHIHPDQDEYLYILEGRLEFMLDGIDHTFRTAAAVRRDDVGRHRKTLPLVGRKRLAWMLRSRERVGKAPRVEDGLGRAVRSDRIHRMRGIAQQGHAAARPIRQGIAVTAGIFPELRRRAH